MTFKTSLGKTAVVITFGVTILFAIILLLQFLLVRNGSLAVPVFTTTTCLLIYFGVFAFRPLDYILNAEALIIKRPLSKVNIQRTDINSVALVDKESIKGTIRTFGVGGLFGYFGHFSNYKIGKMIWYATRIDKMVLIKTKDNRNMILTPDEPENFVSAFAFE